MFTSLAARTLLVLVPLAAFGLQEPKPVPPAVHPNQAWHVLFEAGPKYDPAKPTIAQAGFAEHLKFVFGMVEEGTLLVGGPLLESAVTGPTEPKLTGAVMLLRGKDEKAVRETIALDPFVAGEVIRPVSVRPMVVGAGAWLPK